MLGKEVEVETLLPLSFSSLALPCFPHGTACAQPILVSLGKEKAKGSAGVGGSNSKQPKERRQRRRAVAERLPYMKPSSVLRLGL